MGAGAALVAARGRQAEQLYAYGEALSHYSRARACAERLGQSDQITALDQVIGRVYYARNEIPKGACQL